LALKSGGTYSAFNPAVPETIARLSVQLNEVARRRCQRPARSEPTGCKKEGLVMSIEELTQLADEIMLRDMAKAHVIERDSNKAPWDVTANGWDWMVMLMRLAGIDMKDAKFLDELEQARRAHTTAKH
jgi:hypothetical protein